MRTLHMEMSNATALLCIAQFCGHTSDFSCEPRLGKTEWGVRKARGTANSLRWTAGRVGIVERLWPARIYLSDESECKSSARSTSATNGSTRERRARIRYIQELILSCFYTTRTSKILCKVSREEVTQIIVSFCYSRARVSRGGCA